MSANALEGIIKEELQSHGLLITEEEAKEMAKPGNLTKNRISKKIQELETQRKFKVFMEKPTANSLVEDSDLLNELDKVLKDPDNEYTKRIQSQLKELTIDQIQSSLKALRYRAKWVRVWNMITSWKAIAFIFAIVFVAVSYVLYRSMNKNIRLI